MSIHVHVLTLLQVWHIMQNAKYGTDEDQIGVLRLVQNNSFSGYYPLHEVCMLYVFCELPCFLICFPRTIFFQTLQSCEYNSMAGNIALAQCSRNAFNQNYIYIIIDQHAQCIAPEKTVVHVITCINTFSPGDKFMYMQLCMQTCLHTCETHMCIIICIYVYCMYSSVCVPQMQIQFAGRVYFDQGKPSCGYYLRV